MKRDRWPLLHPFLFALYFVLSIAASNAAAELRGCGDLVWATGATVGSRSFRRARK